MTKEDGRVELEIELQELTEKIDEWQTSLRQARARAKQIKRTLRENDN